MSNEDNNKKSIPSLLTIPAKLIDKINHYQANHGRPFFSLEFFPPRNENELNNFWPMLERFKQGGPLFMDITWHERSSCDPLNELSSLGIAGKVVNHLNHETVLHMTCCNYTEKSLESNLNHAKSLGLRNILALRGDKTNSGNGNEIEENGMKSQPGDDNQVNHDERFTCALEMVKFIRTKFGDYFTIGVAGYPDGHPEAKSYQDDLIYLKAKVDAGADFIITQLSFSFEQYVKFIQDCRSIGIKVPIIPGIFPVQTSGSLRNISKLTKVEAPDEIKKAVQACDSNEIAITELGIKLAVDLCRKLIQADIAPGLHFYTLNREVGVVEILKQLELWSESPRSEQITQEPIKNDSISAEASTALKESS